MLLIRIGKSTHTIKYTKNVKRESIDTELGGVGAGGDVHHEGCVINTRHIDRAGGLVLEGCECSGPDVDTRGRAAVEVLVGLDLVEVSCGADGEAVVAVELDLGVGEGVTTGEGTTSLVGVVSPVVGADGVAVGDVGVELDDPGEELAGVVEVELNLVGGG